MAPGITEISSTFGQSTSCAPIRPLTHAEFDNIVKSLGPNQLLVIDFHAVCIDWPFLLTANLLTHCRCGADRAMRSPPCMGSSLQR
jgi:hypothetical protein